MSEVLQFNLQSGYVSMTTRQPVTFEMISRLAESAQLAGIPAGARINDIRMSMSNNYPDGQEYRVDISWQVG